MVLNGRQIPFQTLQNPCLLSTLEKGRQASTNVSWRGILRLMTVVMGTSTPRILETESWNEIFRTVTEVVFTFLQITELKRNYEGEYQFLTIAVDPHRGRILSKIITHYPRTKALPIHQGKLIKLLIHLIPYPKADFQYTERDGLLSKKTVTAYKPTEVPLLMEPHIISQPTAWANIAP